MLPTRTEIVHQGRRYIVIHDEQGVIGIEANSVVHGRKRIVLDGWLAKRVLAIFNRNAA